MRAASLVLLPLAAACAGSWPAGIPAPERDPHSYARPDLVQVTHLRLVLALDFTAQRLRGTVTLDLLRRDPTAPLVLDTQDLVIESVTAGASPRAHALGEPSPILGQALQITLAPEDRSVTVHYSTTPAAAALQWLAPAQTLGDAPFLYTQGQAILTRSWIPLQDSPGVRITFDASVLAPPGLTVVMAAEQHGSEPGGAHRFRMQQPIPPYLIALACGKLAARDLSPRCRVWAEPAVVERAAREFEDLEAMLRACEELYGPYRWQRYDVLVLPPSFPFGGMENPRLTFATPTILAGDKSLVALIAHELAHSWSGNLVSNATWRDFWLNEGFTVYVENRILERVYGPERAAMEALIGIEGLKKELRELPPGDQVLHVDLTGRNPDDGMTGVPYEKGASFLRLLEQRFGRSTFDPFLREWFARHEFQSVTTRQFVDYLKTGLLEEDDELYAELRIDDWVRRPGLPSNAPVPDSALLRAVDAARHAWLAGGRTEDLPARSWVTQQWLHFLNGLPQDVPASRLAELDDRFHLTAHTNAEILCGWLVVAIRGGHAPAMPRAEWFLSHVGRRKFLKPIYEELCRSETGRTTARQIYALARPTYHAVATRTLDALLGAQR
jgi:aminopeptidase N